MVLLFSSVGKPDETLAFVFEMTSPKKQYRSTRYKNKWAVSIFEDWQRVRSVKFPIVEVGGVFREYELDKVQSLTRPITEMDALRLNCWLSKFVQEVAKCSKDPCPPET